jgi:hypothetical protein
MIANYRMATLLPAHPELYCGHCLPVQLPCQ